MERREEEDRDGDDDEWEDQEVRQSPRSNGLVQCLKMWYCSIPFILFVTSFGFYIYGFVLVYHFSLLLGTDLSYKGKGLPLCEEAVVWIFVNSIIVPLVLLLYIYSIITFDRSKYARDSTIDDCYGVCGGWFDRLGFLCCYYLPLTTLLIAWFIYGTALFWSERVVSSCEPAITTFGFWILFVSLAFILHIVKEFFVNEECGQAYCDYGKYGKKYRDRNDIADVDDADAAQLAAKADRGSVQFIVPDGAEVGSVLSLPHPQGPSRNPFYYTVQKDDKPGAMARFDYIDQSIYYQKFLKGETYPSLQYVYLTD